MKNEWKDYVGRAIARCILLCAVLIAALFFNSSMFFSGFCLGISVLIMAETMAEIIVRYHNSKMKLDELKEVQRILENEKEYVTGEKEVYILKAFDNSGKMQEYYAENLEDAAKLKKYLLESAGGNVITKVEISDKKEVRPWRFKR